MQVSSIRKGLEKAAAGTKIGLLHFFHKATPEEAAEQDRRDRELSKLRYEEKAEIERQIREKAAEKKREDARLRQQKRRGKIYDKEIAQGERSPGGHKRKKRVRVQNNILTLDSHSSLGSLSRRA